MCEPPSVPARTTALWAPDASGRDYSMSTHAPTPSPILLTAFNYARGDVTGVEFSGTYENGPLLLFGNLTISRAIVSSQFNFSQADLDYIAQHYIHQDHDQRFTGSAGAAYSLMQGRATPLRLSTDLLVGSGLRSGNGDIPNGTCQRL